MTDLSWGGFNNGRIPTNLLTLVRGEPFRSDAAAQLLLFEAAFKAQFGHEFVIAEGYRPLERQQILRAAYLAYLAGKGPWAPIANYVGHSVHGWGLAGDFWSNIDRFGTPEHDWAVKNGRRFGWYWGSTPSEAWHFEFRPTAAFVSVEATPIKNATPTPEEDDLMATPEQRAALIDELLNHAAYDKGPTVSEVLKKLDNQLSIPIIADPRDNSLYFASPQTGVQKISDLVSPDMDNDSVVKALDGTFGQYHTPGSAWEFDVVRALIQRAADAYQAKLATGGK